MKPKDVAKKITITKHEEAKVNFLVFSMSSKIDGGVFIVSRTFSSKREAFNFVSRVRKFIKDQRNRKGDLTKYDNFKRIVTSPKERKYWSEDGGKSCCFEDDWSSYGFLKVLSIYITKEEYEVIDY